MNASPSVYALADIMAPILDTHPHTPRNGYYDEPTEDFSYWAWEKDEHDFYYNVVDRLYDPSWLICLDLAAAALGIHRGQP